MSYLNPTQHFLWPLMRLLGVLIKLFMPCTVGALRVDEDGSDVVQIHICLTYTAVLLPTTCLFSTCCGRDEAV